MLDHALHFQKDDEPGLRTGAWMKIRVNPVRNS
jgi:hypothetical protein